MKSQATSLGQEVTIAQLDNALNPVENTKKNLMEANNVPYFHQGIQS